MPRLYTIGYEGASVDELVKTLRLVGVQVLADVRELPLSRKKGLSKKGLASNLAEAGIEYTHYKDLGDPKAGRVAARQGNYLQFERIFTTHLASNEAQKALLNLLKVAESQITCMMCFERCATVCHRSYIADQAALAGFEVYNLVADRPEKYSSNDIQVPRYYPRQSLAAAE